MARKLRPGLLALTGYAMAVATFFCLKPAQWAPAGGDAADEMAAFVLVPLATTFMFLLAVFSYGLSGDLAARESVFPARMFTLPVSTRALAGWPMLYGTTAVMALLLLTTTFVRWASVGNLGVLTLPPWDVEVPAVWPSVLAAVFLAWTQALVWMPYGLRGMRMILAVLWLGTLDVIVFMAVHYEVSEFAMVAFLVPQLPLAYLAACFAVSRSRHGAVPDWRGVFSRADAWSRFARSHPQPFPSPARAQLWFEWRLHGWSLPALVAMLMPFEGALLYLARDEPDAFTFYAVLAMLLTPPFMAGFVAATIGRPGATGAGGHAAAPFVATRPMSGVGLISAKLKVAAGSTLLAWLITLTAIVSGLQAAGRMPLAVERVAEAIESFGQSRVAVALILLVAGLVLSTWKRLVHSLFIDLTGRAWVIKSSVILALSLLVVVWPMGRWIHDDSNLRVALLDALPWILAALAVSKCLAAIWIAKGLYDRRLFADRALVGGALCWMLAVFALYGVLAWLWATPHVARYFLLLVAILEIPLVRLSAAPLALAWNRHR